MTGKLFRKLRRAWGLTQTEVAREAAMDGPDLSRLEQRGDAMDTGLSDRLVVALLVANSRRASEAVGPSE